MDFRGSIALARASGLGPLPRIFGERTSERQLWRALEQAGLPVDIVSDPNLPIPTYAMVGLFERCARLLGDRTFGLDVGFAMETDWGYGTWGQYGWRSATLGEAIQRYNRTVWAHTVGGGIDLLQHQNSWLWRSFGPSFSRSSIQHADHLLGPMIIVARRYLGKDWMPEWVEVSYPRDPQAHLLEDRLQVPILFDRRGTGIAIRSEDLQAGPFRHALLSADDLPLRAVLAEGVLQAAEEPARSLSAIVALRLLDGHTDIEGTARLVGIGVQGLQRRLRERGYTYREIVEAARRERAMSLLRETDLSVLEIALTLGYQDHASFTRAFRHWVGCAPTAYRFRYRPTRKAG
ncbi:helix-turn-helix domain-containing protein [Amorphus orientalis]|uniref:AraC-like DNA-binding protein n=1 Tax=Amorphus orientalis TaxID=649198 RepID=A0AAE3VQR0_9HYPH|nr:AraC family transcriptional regulator [Amorphus orientalis]MDQ0316120.1 AraC-like DNA-binding protein [Amorphus orientalis]